MRTIALTEETRKNVLENLLKRSPSSYGKFEDAVAEIVENVRNNKDAAVFEYTKRFDGADINAGNIKVTKEEIDHAVDEAYKEAAQVRKDVQAKGEEETRYVQQQLLSFGGKEAKNESPKRWVNFGICTKIKIGRFGTD